MLDEATASGPDPGVAELTADFFPADPTGPETAEPTAEPAQTADASQEPAEPSAQAPTAEPIPQKYSINGREFTPDELSRALIMAGQYAGLQEKHLKLLEQQRAPQQPQPQQQPQRQGVTSDQVQALYKPAVQQAVANEVMEADFAEAFPKFSANILYGLDLVKDVRAAAQTLIERMNQSERGSMETAVIQDVYSSIANLSTQGEPFAQLADPQVQQGFFNYLVEINPQLPHLRNPEFLARQWIAYNKDTYLQKAASAQQAIAERDRMKAVNRRNAGGEINSTRPAAVAEQPEGFWDADLLGDRFPPMR